MKKNKKNLKKIAMATSLAVITSFATISPYIASAAELSNGENIISKGIQTKDQIEDVKSALNKSLDNYAINLPKYYTNSDGSPITGEYKGYLSVSWNNIDYRQFSVEADGSPIITDSENIFVGKTTLNNDTDQEQTLSTNSFSKAISNSITNSTTNGFKFGVKASAKFKIPFVGETGLELSTEYNFSDTSSKTSSESYTYTATPQNIKVPAHSSVEVIVNLNTVKAKGDVSLLTKMASNFFTNIIYGSKAYVVNSNLNEMVRNSPELPYIKANSDGQTVNLIGSGTYEAEYGTEFTVTVRPVDKNGRSMNEGYSYKITPEITK